MAPQGLGLRGRPICCPKSRSISKDKTGSALAGSAAGQPRLALGQSGHTLHTVRTANRPRALHSHVLKQGLEDDTTRQAASASHRQTQQPRPWRHRAGESARRDNGSHERSHPSCALFPNLNSQSLRSMEAAPRCCRRRAKVVCRAGRAERKEWRSADPTLPGSAAPSVGNKSERTAQVLS